MTGGSLKKKKGVQTSPKRELLRKKKKRKHFQSLGGSMGVTKAHRCQATRKVPMISRNFDITVFVQELNLGPKVIANHNLAQLLVHGWFGARWFGFRLDPVI